MTYKEAYQKFDTFEDLKDEVAKDVVTALLFNTDRIPVIKKALYEVCNEKGVEINGKTLQ